MPFNTPHKKLKKQTIKSMVKAQPLPKRFAASEDGVAFIEFALIVPVFITLAFSLAELFHFNMVDRRAKHAADFAAEYISRDVDNNMMFWERHVAEDIWQIVNTTSFNRNLNISGDRTRGNYTRGFASIAFDPVDPSCTGNDCEYVANPLWVWSVRGRATARKIRTCEQELVSNNTKLDETTLPKAFAGRSSMIVTDFVYRYEPLMDIKLLERSDKHVISMRKTRGGVTLETPRSHHHNHGYHC